MIKVSKEHLHKLSPLFSHHQYDKVILNTVLEGYHGHAYVDSLENPKIARLDSGTFTLLAGDANLPEAEELLKFKAIQIVTPETEEWAKLIHKIYPSSISQIEFTECFSTSINSCYLDDFINMIPSDYHIKEIDLSLAERIANEMENDYFLEHFSSVNDFLLRGIGYCILHNNQIVSAATSTAACQHAIDVEIKTQPDYQRTGLGTIIGATLVKGCLQKNIDPKWIAANKRSRKLAEKLGYTSGSSYLTLIINE